MARPKLGKRGRFLTFLGALDLIYAVSLFAPDATTRRTPFFVWLTEINSTVAWSAMWAAVGAVCLWQALCRRDAIGFSAAIGLKIGWGLVCLGGWLFGDVERGYVSAGIWLGLAYVTSVVAGWAEPDEAEGKTWTRRPWLR